MGGWAFVIKEINEYVLGWTVWLRERGSTGTPAPLHRENSHRDTPALCRKNLFHDQGRRQQCFYNSVKCLLLEMIFTLFLKRLLSPPVSRFARWLPVMLQMEVAMAGRSGSFAVEHVDSGDLLQVPVAPRKAITRRTTASRTVLIGLRERITSLYSAPVRPHLDTIASLGSFNK
ncbi:hypothetical protein QYF61_014561 [Mycteria americana]|uniref:Uncharacterized protein n=1 Tax=Mycteria americana TaxID=33587 RepID=A0AAN7S798_MYCAM|nr:hypothetical protein QYF61_014561 [Mycteria americana]